MTIKKKKDVDSHLSADITIILITNRNQVLYRILSYIKENYNFSYFIAVYDASPVPWKKTLEYVDYYHMPDTGLHPRIEVAARNLTTEFAKIFPDDDLIPAESILQSIEFLISDTSYGCVKCSSWHYNYYDGEIVYRPISCHAYREDYNENNPIERVRHFFKYYSTPFYGVYRNTTFREVFMNPFISPLYQSRMEATHEEIIGFLTVLVAKYRVLVSKAPWIGPSAPGAPFNYKSYAHKVKNSENKDEINLFERCCKQMIKTICNVNDIKAQEFATPLFALMEHWHDERNDVLRRSFGGIRTKITDDGLTEIAIDPNLDHNYVHSMSSLLNAIRHTDQFIRKYRHFIPKKEKVLLLALQAAQDGKIEQTFNAINDIHTIYSEKEVLYTAVMLNYRFKRYGKAVALANAYIQEFGPRRNIALFLCKSLEHLGLSLHVKSLIDEHIAIFPDDDDFQDLLERMQ